MTESSEQAQLRQHLSELRRAAHGVGHDFNLEFRDIDNKIERLGIATAKDAKYIANEIEDDFAHLGRSIDEEVRRIPGAIASAGTAIGSGAARAATATKDAVVLAGHHAKEGTKNAFAAAAGVKRTPLREWHTPHGSESGSSSDESR